MSITPGVQRPECVTTEKVVADNLCWCGNPILNRRSDARYCGRECQHITTAHGARQARAELNQQLRNLVFAYRNRDRAFTFDGRYEGTTTDPITIVYGRVKDTGHVPMPIDVHVTAPSPKFTTVTPEDVDWAKKQEPFHHSLPMPRAMRNYCAHCKEAVMVGEREVRVTKGVYLPIEHTCPRTRVYDMHGHLLGVL